MRFVISPMRVSAPYSRAKSSTTRPPVTSPMAAAPAAASRGVPSFGTIPLESPFRGIPTHFQHAGIAATPFRSCVYARFPSPMGVRGPRNVSTFQRSNNAPTAHFLFPKGNKLGSAGGRSAIASNSGNCSRSGSGTFTLEPFKMLINCNALTTPFP